MNPLAGDSDGDGLSDWFEMHADTQTYRHVGNGATNASGSGAGMEPYADGAEQFDALDT
jgi:hypothetical protein